MRQTVWVAVLVAMTDVSYGMLVCSDVAVAKGHLDTQLATCRSQGIANTLTVGSMRSFLTEVVQNVSYLQHVEAPSFRADLLRFFSALDYDGKLSFARLVTSLSARFGLPRNNVLEEVIDSGTEYLPVRDQGKFDAARNHSPSLSADYRLLQLQSAIYQAERDVAEAERCVEKARLNGAVGGGAVGGFVVGGTAYLAAASAAVSTSCPPLVLVAGGALLGSATGACACATVTGNWEASNQELSAKRSALCNATTAYNDAKELVIENKPVRMIGN